MIYTIERITRDVRVSIDENARGESLVIEGDIDTLTLDERIRHEITDAARKVEMEAPAELLDGAQNFGDAVEWRAGNSGRIELPEDFMRLTVFKMSDWERPVDEPITATDPRYRLQRSRLEGVRGNPQLPVVAIVRRPEGLALEFYSCKDRTATVEMAAYYPLPRIDRSGGINIPEKVYKAVVAEIAGRLRGE